MNVISYSDVFGETEAPHPSTKVALGRGVMLSRID
jgi:hypothetical protein